MNTFFILRKYILSFFLFAAIVSLSEHATAQRINQMTQTTFSGGYQTIVGAGGIYLGGSGIYYPYDNGNYCYNISMPFAFKYDGTTFGAATTLYVHFGAVSFTNYYPYPYYYPIVNPAPVSGQSASYYQNGI